MKQEFVRLEIALQQPFAWVKNDEGGGDDGEEGYWKVFKWAEKITEKDED